MEMFSAATWSAADLVRAMMPPLGLGVEAVVGDAGDAAGDRGLVDDRPAAVLPHLRDLMLHAVIGALQIRVDNRAEILRRQVEGRAGDLGGRVVDGDLEPAEARDRRRHERLHVRLFRDVGVAVETVRA
jgi:hypothetical protein